MLVPLGIMPKRKSSSNAYCNAESVNTELEESSVEAPPRVSQPTATVEPTGWGNLEGVPANQHKPEVEDIADAGELELRPFWEMLKMAGYEVW